MADVIQTGNAPHGFVTHYADDTTLAYIATLEKNAARYLYLRNRIGSLTDGLPFIAIYSGSFSGWTFENADEKVDEAIALTETTKS